MTIPNYNLESTYNDPFMYGSCGGYYRKNKDYIMGASKHYKLKQIINPKPGDTILLVGAGFGWIAEDWLLSGLGPICAVDTSDWIQNNKNQHAVIEIHNYDVTNKTDQLNIKNYLRISSDKKIKWCITEDVFSDCIDSECLLISQHLRNIGENIVHYISPPPRSSEILCDRNWKTGTQWKMLLSPDLIFMKGTEVLL